MKWKDRIKIEINKIISILSQSINDNIMRADFHPQQPISKRIWQYMRSITFQSIICKCLQMLVNILVLEQNQRRIFWSNCIQPMQHTFHEGCWNYYHIHNMIIIIIIHYHLGSNWIITLLSWEKRATKTVRVTPTPLWNAIEFIIPISHYIIMIIIIIGGY